MANTKKTDPAQDPAAMTITEMLKSGRKAKIDELAKEDAEKLAARVQAEAEERKKRDAERRREEQAKLEISWRYHKAAELALADLHKAITSGTVPMLWGGEPEDVERAYDEIKSNLLDVERQLVNF